MATLAWPSLSFSLWNSFKPYHPSFFSPKSPINHFPVNSSDTQPDVYFDIYLGDHKAWNLSPACVWETNCSETSCSHMFWVQACSCACGLGPSLSSCRAISICCAHMASSKFVLIVTNYVVALKRGNATRNNNTESDRAATGAAVWRHCWPGRLHRVTQWEWLLV